MKENMVKNFVCLAAGAGLSLTVCGVTFLTGIIGAIGGIFGKILCEWIIKKYNKRKIKVVTYVDNSKTEINIK